MADDANKPRDILAQFLDDTSKFVNEVSQTFMEQADKGRQLIDEKRAERDLNRLFQTFGKAVFEQIAKGKLTVPEALQEDVDALRAKIKEVADARERREARQAGPTTEGSGDDDTSEG